MPLLFFKLWVRYLMRQGAWLWAGWPRFDPGVGGVKIFLHSFMSRLVLRSTQPHIKMNIRVFLGVKDQA